mmetsp:Transcript_53175/g.146873  ORF Transcript_53175/g.146873 Transcript_53175/m.146873 type:complete len:247 (-) Transcript_53175:971-1711(-)
MDVGAARVFRHRRAGGRQGRERRRAARLDARDAVPAARLVPRGAHARAAAQKVAHVCGPRVPRPPDAGRHLPAVDGRPGLCAQGGAGAAGRRHTHRRPAGRHPLCGAARRVRRAELPPVVADEGGRRPRVDQDGARLPLANRLLAQAALVRVLLRRLHHPHQPLDRRRPRRHGHPRRMGVDVPRARHLCADVAAHEGPLPGQPAARYPGARHQQDARDGRPRLPPLPLALPAQVLRDPLHHLPARR